MLPETFQFSQGKLQDYVDCPRRFELRHVLMQPWPALITESPGEFEEHQRRGAQFHRLVQQHTLGLHPGQLDPTIRDPTIRRWWRKYLEHPPPGLPEKVRRAEVVVTAPLADYRLLAKFDLLAVEPAHQLIIVDWKTVLKRPSRSVLRQRLQTRLYRYLAVEATAAFNGGQRPQPDQVRMVYWFAASEDVTESFDLDATQFRQERDYLIDLIAQIVARREPDWDLTTDTHRCRFCRYRSFCERDVRPGFLSELDDDPESDDWEIDLEQIAEVVF
jgi:hypothetical protein